MILGSKHVGAILNILMQKKKEYVCALVGVLIKWAWNIFGKFVRCSQVYLLAFLSWNWPLFRTEEHIYLAQLWTVCCGKGHWHRRKPAAWERRGPECRSVSGRASGKLGDALLCQVRRDASRLLRMRHERLPNSNACRPAWTNPPVRKMRYLW